MKTITQEQLDKITESHRHWLNGSPYGKRMVLEGINISGLSLTGLDLRKSFISHCDLSHVYANQASFEDATFEYADMSNFRALYANFSNARLLYVNLDKAELYFSSFKNTIFTDAKPNLVFVRKNLRHDTDTTKKERYDINSVFDINDQGYVKDSKETRSIQVRLSENFGKWTEKIYDYYTELDLKIGDIVVVDTVYGATLGKVESFKEANKNSVLKWVVQKVDTKEAREKFEKLKKDSEKKEEQEEKLNKIKKEILARKKVLDETELIKYYAEKDIVMKGLLTQYNCMKKESEQ